MLALRTSRLGQEATESGQTSFKSTPNDSKNSGRNNWKMKWVLQTFGKIKLFQHYTHIYAGAQLEGGRWRSAPIHVMYVYFCISYNFLLFFTLQDIFECIWISFMMIIQNKKKLHLKRNEFCVEALKGK